MKKFFLIMAICAISSIGAKAWIYNTSCGRAVQTVSPDFFTDDEERQGFYNDLDEIYCGN